MTKRISATLVLALAATALACVSFAQDIGPVPVPSPDATVKGSGAISLPGGPASTVPNVGMVNVSVARARGVLYGGFAFREMSPRGVRVHTLVSRRLTALNVIGNRATIRAEGTFDGRPCCLTLEVLDDNPSGDWIRITADGCMMTVIYYSANGGLKSGDIAVWSATPPGGAYANGTGAVPVKNLNIGKFWFKAEELLRPDAATAAAMGVISYMEYNAAILAVDVRPANSIYVPRVAYLKVDGFSAILGGPGTWNGRPAKVEVRVRDTAMLDCICPDEFHITADTIVPEGSLMPVLHYEAGGPILPGGNINVGTYPTNAP